MGNSGVFDAAWQAMYAQLATRLGAAGVLPDGRLVCPECGEPDLVLTVLQDEYDHAMADPAYEPKIQGGCLSCNYETDTEI